MKFWPPSQAINIVQDAKRRLDSLDGEKATSLKAKLDSVLQKNSNLEILSKAAKALKGEAVELPAGMGPKDIAELKFAPHHQCGC